MNFLFNLLFGMFALYVLWSAVKPRWHFKIVVSPHAVETIRGVPQAKRQTFETFLIEDLKLAKKLKIYGRRQPAGRWIVLIKGTDDEGLKQRIRNFFYSSL